MANITKKKPNMKIGMLTEGGISSPLRAAEVKGALRTTAPASIPSTTGILFPGAKTYTPSSPGAIVGISGVCLGTDPGGGSLCSSYGSTFVGLSIDSFNAA